MKKLLFVAFLLFSLQVFPQDSTAIGYQNLDTIDSYVNILISAGTSGYFVNEKRVDRKTYDGYKRVMDKIDQCKPCWVKNYTVEGDFVSEGVYYTDCLVGTYIEYHSNGRRKLSGHYKENHTGNWSQIFQRGYCRRDGIWSYYDESGRIIKQEKYKDGQLVQ